jgi:hypothetical protein
LSTAILHARLNDAGPALAAATEKLAALRYLIILTAHWASGDCVDAERRARFHADLVRLRREYSDKIDEIAMSFGVQQAMDSQQMVERTVSVPHCAIPSVEPQPIESQQDDHGWF